MVTHDVDEALLLADRVVMMTSGPAATIGEILSVPFPRPRRPRRSSPRASTSRSVTRRPVSSKSAPMPNPEGGCARPFARTAAWDVGCSCRSKAARSGASRAIPITRRAGATSAPGRPPASGALHADRLLYPHVRTRRDAEPSPRCRGAGRALRCRPPAGDRDRPRPGRGRLLRLGAAPDEEYYVASKLAKGFLAPTTSTRTPDSAWRRRGRLPPGPSDPTARGRLCDIESADCFFLVGTNTATAIRDLEADTQRKLPPRRRAVTWRSAMTETADVADLHLPLRPGSDIALSTDAPRAVERRIARSGLRGSAHERLAGTPGR